ncbi:DNA polymerase Y family protein [Methyloligella sp. 2.7D]|uniref:Y-family DNA polymerase n=1 Tax=unclassified Methyloligella TaxID=2625955 RepID=UPI00157C3237|nr:DNA polymerase Y family protein [Methyloligella sp. GL2]QKP76743.1 DNA polymerase Y family protein [Methyloligella sp. GL2]
MRRMVSVWLPHWPIERLRRERRSAAPQAQANETRQTWPGGQPFALVASEAQALQLTAVNGPARALRLSEGLSLADARAICPHLLTAPATPEKDARALLALTRWAERFSPLRAPDGTDGLILDVTGVSHLFGGEHALLGTIANSLERFGFTARIGLAETIGGAWALARFAPGRATIATEGTIAQTLAPLPVEALRLSREAVLLLQRLGLKRIGQLYGISRVSLKRRFTSKEAAKAVLLRLDQALGRANESFSPLRPEPRFEARLPFPEPLISHDGVIGGLAVLAEELCRRLTRAHRGARRVELRLSRSDGSTGLAQAGFSAPCREADHLCRLLEEKLDGLDLGFGIDTMRLVALLTEPLPPSQNALTKTAQQELAPFIDRLAGRLGPAALLYLAPRQSHIPERAQRAQSAIAKRPPWPREVLSHLAARPRRPALFLPRPEPLSVMAEIPEGPPARFTWRRLSRRVVKAEGPERIAPEWWRIPSPRKGEGGDGQRPAPGGGQATSENRPDPLPSPPPSRGREQSLPSGKRGRHPGESRDPVANDLGAADCPVEPERDRKERSKPPPRTRDYYRIEDDQGRRYWVFREGLYTEPGDTPPAWYMHGLFG